MNSAEEKLRAENAELRARLAEKEETLGAIRSGEVDALVVEGADGPQVFVLQSADLEANRFRSDILAKVSEAIIALDEARRVIYVNGAAEQQYGVESAQVLGQPLSALYENRWLAVGDGERALAAITERGQWRGRSLHVKRNGEKIHVETSVSRLLGKDDAPAGLLGVIRDISDQIAAEESLRTNEQLFSTIIEQAPGGVYVVDDAFRTVKVNALARPTFAAAEPVIGRDFGEVMAILWGAELGGQICAIFRHTLETGERYVAPRFSNQRQDLREQRSYEWETQRLTLPDGKFGVVCYYSDVTEREQAADALRESENFNRSIVESSPDCIKVLELDGTLVSMSDRGRALLGIGDFAPFMGKSWIEFWGGADHEAARVAVETAAAGGNGAMVGFFRTLHGEAKWFDVAISPVKDGDGRPVRLLAISRDITERRRTELDARLLAGVSDDLATLSAAPEIMETVGAKLGAHLSLSVCNFVNIDDAAGTCEVAYDWHRVDVPNSVGKYRLADYFSAEFQAASRAGEPFIVRDTATDPRTVAAAFEAMKMRAFVCVPLVRDGQWRFSLNIHASVPRDWQPDEIELTRELTTRVWTRLERVRIEAALHESEARFRAAVGAVSSLIWTNNAAGMMEGEQVGWGNFTGQTRAEYQGYGWANAVHPDDAQPTIEAWEQAVAEKRPFEFEHRVRRHDGAWRLCVIRAVPVLAEGGAIREWVGVHTDITTRRELEASLVARAEELARADRSKDEFLAMLAHELRNPLAPLRNATEILRTENASAEERAQAQRILGRQIENMSRMIDDLLDVSRITEGKIELRKQPVALETILTAATSLVRSACSAQGQQLAVSMPAEPVWLDADATRLEQVFSNLLGNACKYGGLGCHISLSAERVAKGPASEVLVRVRDDGAGIDPELLPRIFDLFVQASRTLDREHGGLGIGLTLVRRLVNLHGGSIEARSHGLGHGAEFIVRLPVLAEAPAPRPAPAPKTARDTPRRMLIVDDNTDSARSLAMLQSRRGHETRTAFTGPDAVTAAAEFLPEVVLLDIGLPGMDGYEVARQIRAMPALANAFLVAMTGYGSDDDREQAKLAGFDEYLVKPANLDLLREWLRDRAGRPK